MEQMKMNLPYRKCKCCGKRIGLLEWCRVFKITVGKMRKLADKGYSKQEALKIIEKERKVKIHI